MIKSALEYDAISFICSNNKNKPLLLVPCSELVNCNVIKLVKIAMTKQTPERIKNLYFFITKKYLNEESLNKLLFYFSNYKVAAPVIIQAVAAPAFETTGSGAIVAPKEMGIPHSKTILLISVV